MKNKIKGMMLGVGIGDALGIPLENMSYKDIQSAYGIVTDYLYKPFLSDDTSLTIAVAEALLEDRTLGAQTQTLESQAKHHIAAYNESTYGWGSTTRLAVQKLKDGVHWSVSGTKGGKITGLGNGCAMKIAPVAVVLIADEFKFFSSLVQFQGVNFIADLCAMTHQTSLAISSGLAQAAAIKYCLQQKPSSFNANEFLDAVINASEFGKRYFPDTFVQDLSLRLAECYNYKNWPVERCVEELKGTCYVYNSLPFSYMFFLRNPNSIDSLYQVVSAGGDTDSNASMVGALLGALNGKDIFPSHLAEKPIFNKLNNVAERLAERFTLLMHENCSIK